MGDCAGSMADVFESIAAEIIGITPIQRTHLSITHNLLPPFQESFFRTFMLCTNFISTADVCEYVVYFMGFFAFFQ